jgi:putative pyruvate formate lyase activating enzyme
VNLITGTHFIPRIAEGLQCARERGLSLPIVWNSSGFEDPEALSLIDPYIDIYLPDFKTSDTVIAAQLFDRSDYPDAAMETLDFMTIRKPRKGETEHIEGGVIIRHLVLPGLLDSTRKVLAVFAERYKDKALLSLMFQYRPVRQLNGPLKKGFRSNSQLYNAEYHQVCAWLDDFGIEEGYIQEFEGEEEAEWTPDFSKTSPFSSSKSRVIWSYR